MAEVLHVPALARDNDRNMQAWNSAC